MSRLLRMYKILRQENEAIVQLKQLTPNHKVPFGLLRKGPNAIKEGKTVCHSLLLRCPLLCSALLCSAAL